MPEQDRTSVRHGPSTTRRTLLGSLGTLTSVSGVAGVVSASEKSGSKYNGLHDFPSVADKYEQYQKQGKTEQARKILSKNNIGYGHASAVPVETTEGVKSLTTNLDGPYAQGKPPVTTQDVWEKSGAQIGVNAIKLGEEHVSGFSNKLPRFQVGLNLTLSDGNLFSPQNPGPADVAAISFEGSHWLPQTQSTSRPPSSIGEGGSVEYDEMKSDHFRWRFSEPAPISVGDGMFTYFFNGEAHMHPNAEGISQFFGHYSHAWELAGGSIDKISIGAGVFNIGTTLGANDWELSTDSLTVTP